MRRVFFLYPFDFLGLSVEEDPVGFMDGVLDSLYGWIRGDLLRVKRFHRDFGECDMGYWEWLSMERDADDRLRNGGGDD